MSYLSKGLTYKMEGEYEKAISAFSKAIELNPETTEVSSIYLERGFAYKFVGNEYLALADIKTAARMGDKIAINYLKLQGKP